MILTTDRLSLRKWTVEDQLEFRRIAQDPKVMEFIGLGRIWSDEEIGNFIDRNIEQQRQRGYSLWPMIDPADGAFIGFCGLSYLAKLEQVEIGWWLGSDYWGRGLAAEAAQAVIRHGFEELGLEEIIAYAQPANTRSIRIMEKLGMTRDRVDRDSRGQEIVFYSRKR